MDPKLVGGRKLKLAMIVAVALTAFATASYAGHRAGYYPSGHAYPRFISAGYRHYGGGHGGYRGHRFYRAPVRYYRAPRLHLGFGLSFGYPRYHAPPPVYVYRAPHRVYHKRVDDDRVYEREKHHDSNRHDRDYDRDDRDYDREDDSSFRSGEIDVENEPPPGTFYRDRFCNRTFSTLDDYTEHLDGENHSETIDIIDRDSGKRLRTLEFVGYWEVQQ